VKTGWKAVIQASPTRRSRPRENEDSYDVAAAEKGVSGLADRYATALFDLADEQKALDAVAGDMKSLRAMLRDSVDFRRLIRSPVLSRQAQGKAVAALGAEAQLSPLTRNFLGLLAQNRRLFALPEMIESYLSRLAEKRGEVTAHVLAAQDLSPQQREAVNEQLRKAVGRKVAVDLEVDPSLIGGLVVRVGSRMVDASLRSKLNRLQLAMKGVQ
jgi:F-type H+-transporting ATPase subunit delta